MASRIMQCCRPYRHLSGFSAHFNRLVTVSSSSCRHRADYLHSWAFVAPRLLQSPQSLSWPRIVFVSSFHSSPGSQLPARRRKRSQALTPTTAQDDESNDEEEVDDANSPARKKDKRSRAVQGLRHQAVTDSAVFLTAAKVLLAKLEEALQPMKPFNDPFLITRGYEDDMGEFLLLDLGSLWGQYTIQIDEPNKVLLLKSPISGQVVYILSAKTGKWVGEEDGHDFEGLFVRDLIRQSNGLPKL